MDFPYIFDPIELMYLLSTILHLWMAQVDCGGFLTFLIWWCLCCCFLKNCKPVWSFEFFSPFKILTFLFVSFFNSLFPVILFFCFSFLDLQKLLLCLFLYSFHFVFVCLFVMLFCLVVFFFVSILIFVFSFIPCLGRSCLWLKTGQVTIFLVWL